MLKIMFKKIFTILPVPVYYCSYSVCFCVTGPCFVMATISEVLSSLATISLRERERERERERWLLYRNHVYPDVLVSVLCFFLVVPYVGLWSVIGTFSGHNQLSLLVTQLNKFLHIG